MTKVGTCKTELVFPAASVTVIVQLAYVPAVNASNVTVLLPLVADVVADEHEPPYVIVPTSVEENVNDGVVSFPGVGTGVTTARTGATVSIVKDGTCNTDETFPAASVTVIVQSEYVPEVKASNVTVLLPLVAEPVADEQEPPYVMEPASVELKVNAGVVSWPGVGTGVTTASVGTAVSMTNVGTFNTELVLPAASVTVIVQSVYVPSINALNATVIFPKIADVAADAQEPPYVIVPASVEWNVKLGVVS